MTYSLGKPWNERPSYLDAIPDSSQNLPLTPVSAASPDSIPLRSLPSGLTDLVKNSSPQISVTEYATVHAWWWVAYEGMLAEMKEGGYETGWQEVDQMVKRETLDTNLGERK